jgi:hypothetical protein
MDQTNFKKKSWHVVYSNNRCYFLEGRYIDFKVGELLGAFRILRRFYCLFDFMQSSLGP